MASRIQRAAAPALAAQGTQQTRAVRAAAAPLTLIFDGSCPFCTTTAAVLGLLDWRRRLRMVPFQWPGVPKRVGLTYAQCEQSVWAFAPNGRKHSGAAAAALALDTALGIPLFFPLVRRPLIGQGADALYYWVARNRWRFPGITAYCKRPGAGCVPPPRRVS